MSKHLITSILTVGLVAVLSTIGLASMRWTTTNITRMPVSVTYTESGKKVFRNMSGLFSNFVLVDRDADSVAGSRNHYFVSLHTEGKAGSNMVIDESAVGSGVTSGSKTSVLACQQVVQDENTILLGDGLSLTPDVVLLKMDLTKNSADTATFNIKMTAAGTLNHMGELTPGQVVVSATATAVPVQNIPNELIGRDFTFANQTGISNPTAVDQSVSFDFGDKGTVDLTSGSFSPNGGVLSAAVVSGPFDGPFNGSIPGSNNLATGRAEYTPDTGFSGTDSFTYFLRDSINHRSDSRTVKVKVGDRPVAHDAQLTRFVFKNQTSAVFINLSSFVEHRPNRNIHFGNITGVEHGRLSSKDHRLGRVAYRPNSGFSGEDHFHYSIDDKLGYHQEAVVTLSVVPFAVDDDFFVKAFTANAVTLDVLADDKGTDFIGTPPVTPLQIVSVVKLTNTTSTVAISDDKKHILYTPGNSPVLSDDSFMYEVEDTSRPLLNRPVSAAIVRVHITP